MNVSTMVRMAALSALAALAAACGESPTAPGAQFPGGPALPEGPSHSTSSTYSASITIDPAKSATYWFGEHKVYIPAGAVCADGGYGPTVWENDCTPKTSPTTMTVTYTSGSTPSASFGTDVRFRPAAGWVVLRMKVYGPLDERLKYGVLYTPTGTTQQIDESLSDARLRAWRSSGNYIARKMRHFSGYNVALGTYDESCEDSNGDGMCDTSTGEVQ